MRNWVKITGVNLLGLVLLMLLVEGSVRTIHPEIRPRGTDRRLFADSVYGEAPGLRAGARGVSDGKRFEVGGDGFWLYAAARPDSLPAWLFLGDSVTMGIGVDPDSTFAGRIAARFDNVRVLNPSMIGYASRHYEAVARAILRAGEDVRRIVLLWCLNDVYEPSLADPGADLRSAVGPILDFLRKHVRTYEWAKTITTDRPGVYFKHDVALYEPGVPVASIRDLASIAQLQVAGVRVDLVVVPYEFQLRDAGDVDRFVPQRVLRTLADSLEIHFHDPSAFLASRASDSADLYLFGDGIHLSDRGHRLLAEYLVTELM